MLHRLTLEEHKADFSRADYDSAAGTSWLGRTDTGNFITYDDANSIDAKLSYISTNKLGGLICFEIGQQYSNGSNPLLNAIDTALGK